jgi:hypothetical protein
MQFQKYSSLANCWSTLFPEDPRSWDDVKDLELDMQMFVCFYTFMTDLNAAKKSVHDLYVAQLKQIAVDCPKLAETMGPVYAKIGEKMKEGPIVMKENEDGVLVPVGMDDLFDFNKKTVEQLQKVVKEDLTQEERETTMKKLKEEDAE